jgi:1,4-dihydroxy-2-naphthoate octaprenyltransferase
VGTALAQANGHFQPLPALAALSGAVLLQIGVNLANDYFDGVKGIDAGERLGPVRVTQSGLIPLAQMRIGMFLTFLLATIVGLYLVFVGGWPVVIIGVCSMLAALAYSGGPYPLASHGLGDLFVFVFFGLVAVSGTYYVQALEMSWLSVLSAVPTGLLITAILVVNNLRDMETDLKSRKYTLAVLLGSRATKVEYVALVTGAFISAIVFWLGGLYPSAALLTLLSLPLAVPAIRSILKDSGALLNHTLAKTARLALIFSILMGLGLIVGN